MKGCPMIAHAKKLRAQALHDRFLDMLPSIRQQVRFAFRAETPERRDDLVTEVIANCWVAFVRLMDHGKEDEVHATPLAQYAIKQVRDGRKVGSKLNVNDVSSEYAQKVKGIKVESLVRYNDRKQEWREILIEDRHAGPAETAACRIDFGDWLRSLPRRSRRIAQTLAAGETTKNAARKHRVSAGRISQMRRELKDNWEVFQGEAVAAGVA